MTNPSKPVPPSTPPPSPPPPGPRHPAPSSPPGPRYVDNLFSLAASLGADVAIDSGWGAAGELSSRPVYVTPARPFSTVGRGAQGGPVYSGRDGKGAVERASRPVELPSGGGRAGGVSSPAPGAVSGFALPEPPGPPRFDGDGPPRPGQPGPPPRPQPTGPVPHPPPPISA